MASIDDAAEAEAKIDWLFDHAADTLSTWEADFLRSIEGAAALSVRQREKLDEIVEKHGGMRIFATFLPRVRGVR